MEIKYTNQELEEALQIVSSTIGRCEAMYIAKFLIAEEFSKRS